MKNLYHSEYAEEIRIKKAIPRLRDKVVLIKIDFHRASISTRHGNLITRVYEKKKTSSTRLLPHIYSSLRKFFSQ